MIPMFLKQRFMILTCFVTMIHDMIPLPPANKYTGLVSLNLLPFMILLGSNVATLFFFFNSPVCDAYET